MAGNSLGTKKGKAKKVEQHGPDYFKRIGAIGGRARKRGYFGRLKDEGKLDELKSASEDKWDALVAEMDKIRDAFVHSFHYFKSRF